MVMASFSQCLLVSNVLRCILLVCLLSACAGNQYFHLAPQPVSNLAHAHAHAPLSQFDWHSLETAELIARCQPTETNNLLMLMSCSDALLARVDLNPQQLAIGQQWYNQSVTRLLALAVHNKTPDNWQIELRAEQAGVQLNELVLSSDIKVMDPRLDFRVFGDIGALAVVRYPNSAKGLDKFYPLEGLFRAVDFQFDSIRWSTNKVSLTLSYRQTDRPTAVFKGDNRYTRRYSPSLVYLSLIEKANIDDFSLLGLIEAAKAEFRRGIFAIEPLSTQKIPLIMTHGLNSDPLIWTYLTMAILRDEQLNSRYQIWHFYYPSGPPPFYSAMRLRKTLNNLLNSIDNPDLARQAVFVGHSMGGIINKLLTSRSDYTLWDAVFTERPDKLAPKPKADLQQIFMFEPVFSQNVVYFLDTPHRGSDVATSFIGYLSSWLVNLPHSFTDIFGKYVNQVGEDKLTPEMQAFSSGPTSIQVLQPNYPLLLALQKLPVAGQVYSIVGSQGATECGPVSDCGALNDGVVDYQSAHYPDAQQEIIVSSRHNSFKNQQAIEFILSQLRLVQQGK